MTSLATPEHSERWGYAMWGIAALVIVIPEVTTASYGHLPWPTISATVGHLEYSHSWVALIVVAVIVCVTYQILRYPSDPPAPEVQVEDGRARRSPRGRLMRKSPIPKDVLGRYIALGVLFVGLGSFLTAEFDSDRFVLAYVLYGLIAVVFVVVPSALAFGRARDVPFPTLYRTLANLEGRCHVLAVIVVIGLVVLLIHLSLYPWPSVFHQLRAPTPSSS